MGYYDHNNWNQDAHYFNLYDGVKIAFDVDGPTLTVDAYTNLSDKADIAIEQQLAEFLGGITDPNADADRFEGIDGTDHLKITVNTETGVADLTFRDSSEWKFDRIAADPFPTQELLSLVSGGDPAHPVTFALDNDLKLAVGAGSDGLKIDAYTNLPESAVALEQAVVKFAGDLIDPTGDPAQFNGVDGTDHFTFTFNPQTDAASLTFQPIDEATFTGLAAEPFPLDKLVALLTGETSSGGDDSHDCGSDRADYDFGHQDWTPQHHHHDLVDA